jgi:DNA-binding SARP family transcriptional activator/class 3 adenylate cyclase/tetratricopeptide (TPR) repeat protein
MEFRILGPLEVSSEGRVLDLGGAKQRALLAMLLLDANSVVSKGRLIDALWEDDPPETARKALQVHVSGLRKVLGKERVVTREPGYLLRVEEDELDLARFQRLREQGKPADALALWRGEPLSEFGMRRFAQSDIARLEDARLACLEERIDQDLRAGRHAELTGELEGLVNEHPLRERLRALLMLALYRSGRQAEALAAYQEARRALVEELGIEPGKQLRDLHQAVLNQDPALDVPAEKGRVREPEDAAVPSEADRGPEALARRVCGRCGESNPPEARLCFSCGAVLPGRARPAAERRLVTVLFVDLVDFTGIAERLDPEDLKRVVAPYLDRVRGGIERFGGHLEKYIGDAVMALFGAPVAYGDDPERALRAAFAVRDAVASLSKTGAELELKVRIGVNTGEALVDLAADTAAGRGMASGDVVVTSFRLQQAAPVNGILVGEGTYRATHRLVDYREGDHPVAAKGREEPLRAWVATGLRDGPGRPPVELVGRQAELGHLRSVIVPPAAEGPRIVTLVGPPGVGKSRLLWELCQDAEGQVLWRQGRCLSYGAGVSFSAFAAIVKSHAGILESDPLEDVERKLAQAVGAAIDDESSSDWVEAYLRPLVGLGGAERLSGDRRAEAFSAWRRFLEALAAQRPVVLALEDVHWADDGLLDFVEHVGDWAQGVPLTVFCTARPDLLERRQRWPGVIQLEPLSADDTRALLDALLGPEQLGPELRAELIARVGGNPLYAEEFARLVKERRAAERLRLPETIQATIAGRLDSLHPEARELLHDAAVIGTAFWPGALARLSGLRIEQVERRLGELQWKELIRPLPRSAIADESQYVFWHVLVRDVAYAQIPRAGRAEKHRRAAEWIESLAPGRADLAELLAHHYGSALEYARLAHQESGPLEERARLALRDAGEHAMTLYAFPAAVRFFRNAVELWPSDDSERPRLLLNVGKSLFWAERGGDVELADARDALLESGELAHASQADVLLSKLALARGDRDDASAQALAAVDLLRDSEPSREQAEALSNLVAFHTVWGESDRALEASVQALALAEALALDEVKAETLTYRGHARIQSGERDGLHDLEQAVALAEALDSIGLVRRYANLATTLELLGELGRAWEVYERGRSAAERFGDALGLHWLAAERLYEYYWRGDWNDAIEAAKALLAEPDAGYGRHASMIVRAWIRLARGDVAGALEDSSGALEFARQAKDTAALCQALALRARVLAESGHRDQAASPIDEVMDLSVDSGVLASFWTADLAEAARELGRGDEVSRLAAIVRMPTRWLAAACRLVEDAHVDAADAYAAIGARPEEARARLRASAALAAGGRHTDAEHQLGLALDFYRAVGADAYLRVAESLLTAPA